MYKFVSILVLLLSAISISSCAKTVEKEKSRIAEEAAVYSTLLNENPVRYLEGSPLIIFEETNYVELEENEYLKRVAPSLSKETLEDYRLVNKELQTLNIPLSTNTPYKYMSDAEWKSLVNVFDWTEFIKKYPNAGPVTSFSKIGFNKNLDQALVYMEHYCGGECAIGNIYFLVRIEDTWTIKGIIEIWVS